LKHKEDGNMNLLFEVYIKTADGTYRYEGLASGTTYEEARKNAAQQTNTEESNISMSQR